MSTQKSKWAIREQGTNPASGERPALRQPQSAAYAAAESELAGFSGTCASTSLADWIQLVQMGRKDAVISIRTHTGKMGRLWCRGGDIIDASCDGLVGEDAVYSALAWESGRVSVEFRSFERPRQISAATAALLLQAAYRRDSGVRELANTRSASSRPPGAFPATPSNRPPPEALTAPDDSRRRWPSRKVIALASAMAVLALLLVSAAAFRSGAPASEVPKVEGASGFLVRLEVEPAHAELSLDGKLLGVGKLDTTLPRDGRLHEVRASAPGYISERLFFRDTPVARQVRLVKEPAASAAVVPAAAAPVREPKHIQAKPSARLAQAKATPRVPAASMAPPKAPNTLSALEKREPAGTKADPPETQVAPPRIRIIDDRAPRIEVIE